MKKTILFVIMMMAVCGTNAQLVVDSVGTVKLGHSTNTFDTRLHINGRGEYGIYNSNNDNTVVKYGICNHIYANNPYRNVFGLSSTAWGPKTGQNYKTIGIKGNAYGLSSTSGVAIGVWGYLSSSNTPHRAIGILGSTTSSFSNNMVDTMYAGFFNGLTKVKGDFIVTGNIQGTFLGNPAASSGLSQGEPSEGRSSQVMSNALKGLTANAFYHELSNETLRAINTDNTTSKSQPIDYENLTEEDILAMEEAELNVDDTDAIPELSAIEKQILMKQHYGLDANQLEEVFPDLVYENEDGSKSINYVEMVPILVQAINELNAKIEVLEGGNAAKKAATRATGIEETGGNVTLLSLGQNKPNPFGTTTSIEVSIPNEVQKAFIYVYDLQGKKVDQVDITARGKQTIQLNAAALTDGMYLYSLIADGKVVETRRMIVEK